MAKRKQHPADKQTLIATRPAEIAQAFNEGDLKRFYDEWHKLRGRLADSPNLLAQAEHDIAFAITDEGTSEESRLAAFREVVKVNPYQLRDYEALNDAGVDLSDFHHYHAAITKYKQTLKLNPDYYEALNNYGSALDNLGQYNDAITKYEHALKLKSDYTECLINYGITLHNLKRYDLAILKYEQAFRFESDYHEYWNNYGVTLQKLGRYNEAITKYKQLLRLKPHFTETWLNYGMTLIELRQYKEAIEKFEIAINTPRAGQFTNGIYLYLGSLYYRIQQETQAKHYFDRLLEISDDKDKQKIKIAIEMLAMQYGSDEALDMLEEIVETSPHYAEARKWLGRTATGKRFFNLFKGDTTIKDTESLNRAMYHKIGNEVAVLKSIVNRLIYLSPTPHALLVEISQQLDNLPTLIKERRERGQQEIQAAEFDRVLQAISAVAHDVSDLVNNELAVIESKTRRLLLNLAENDPTKLSFDKLLTQVKFTQAALNDLKAINEGIHIKASRFPVKVLFEKWVLQPQLDNATITVTLENGEAIFNGDAEKIKSAINELVENSLKHNEAQAELQIEITTQDEPKPALVPRGNLQHHDRYLAIIYRDNGQGVPADKKQWIFAPLNTTSAEGKGSGLGLFIIKKTIEKMHGYIYETGEQGARFEIYLPYLKEDVYGSVELIS